MLSAFHTDRVSPYYIDHMTMYVHIMCCSVLRDLLKLCISSSELHMTYAVFCSCLMNARVICSVVNGFGLLSDIILYNYIAKESYIIVWCLFLKINRSDDNLYNQSVVHTRHITRIIIYMD